MHFRPRQCLFQEYPCCIIYSTSIMLKIKSRCLIQCSLHYFRIMHFVRSVSESLSVFLFSFSGVVHCDLPIQDGSYLFGAHWRDTALFLCHLLHHSNQSHWTYIHPFYWSHWQSISFQASCESHLQVCLRFHILPCSFIILLTEKMWTSVAVKDIFIIFSSLSY